MRLQLHPLALDREGQVDAVKPDDAQLVKRAQAGDRAAAGELFLRHRGLVKYICHRYHGPSHEDLFSAASEGFLIGMRKWKPGRGTKFKVWVSWWVRAYVARFTRYWALDRSRLVSRTLQAQNDDGDELEVDVSDDGRFEAALIDGLASRQLEGMIDGLTDRHLALSLQLRASGLTNKEIGKRSPVGLKSYESARQAVKRGVALMRRATA